MAGGAFLDRLHPSVRVSRAPAAFAPLAAALLLWSAAAQAASALEATCEIRFSGTSTLHGWEGAAPTVRTEVRPAAAPGRWDVDVVVPVAGLDTDNDSRDERLREVLDAARWPEIRAELRDVDPEAVARSGRLDLVLTIRDVSRPLVARVHDWKQADGAVTFAADVPVFFSAFSLTPPSVFGLLRVGDEVTVRTHVTVRTDGATP